MRLEYDISPDVSEIKWRVDPEALAEICFRPTVNVVASRIGRNTTEFVSKPSVWRGGLCG